MPSRARTFVSCLFALTTLATPTSTSAQDEWKWPDKPANLKVLPKDFTGNRLRPVMIGFTRALGVRCSHCHLGKEGAPLSTYDFASDANPKKEVARGMLRMLGSINDQLEEIRPEAKDRVNMWCHTCHRGRPLPRTLVEELTLFYVGEGADSTVRHYRDLRTRFRDAGAYDFREPGLNEIGYLALQKKDLTGAISIFKLNAEMFPESANAFDSLGEAYAAAGDTVNAVASLETSLRLDPKNEHAASLLKQLRRGDGKAK